METTDPDIGDSAYLVAFKAPGDDPRRVREDLEELALLCDTMGLVPTEKVIVPLKEPSPQYYLGTGKAREIVEEARGQDAGIIVIDAPLSPRQQRNWERLVPDGELAVIDREEVILEIFARRASTKEATLQVALARMQYSLPRLTRAWTHLSRQRGGARGTRGEGETQLEADRRIVLRKIARLRSELQKVVSHRSVARHRRMAVPVPTVALVGYTNAGKSSLFNAFTSSDAFVENRLFATLDSTTRRITLPGGRDILLSDTVGFIRKLPHDLVESFKATLEETLYADVIIHVIDGSSEFADDHARVTLEVLDELGAGDKPVITVYNKKDLWKSPPVMPSQAYPVSAVTHEGLEELLGAVETAIFESLPSFALRVPLDRTDIPALLRRQGRVTEERYEEDGIYLVAQASEKVKARITEFILE